MKEFTETVVGSNNYSSKSFHCVWLIQWYLESSEIILITIFVLLSISTNASALASEQLLSPMLFFLPCLPLFGYKSVTSTLEGSRAWVFSLAQSDSLSLFYSVIYPLNSALIDWNCFQSKEKRNQELLI